MYTTLSVLFFILTVTTFVLSIVTSNPALPLLSAWCGLVAARAASFVAW